MQPLSQKQQPQVVVGKSAVRLDLDGLLVEPSGARELAPALEQHAQVRQRSGVLRVVSQRCLVRLFGLRVQPDVAVCGPEKRVCAIRGNLLQPECQRLLQAANDVELVVRPLVIGDRFRRHAIAVGAFAQPGLEHGSIIPPSIDSIPQLAEMPADAERYPAISLREVHRSTASPDVQSSHRYTPYRSTTYTDEPLIPTQ
jgi:hypothetical protein